MSKKSEGFNKMRQRKNFSKSTLMAPQNFQDLSVPELHLFIIWQNGLFESENIIKDISDRFEIVKVYRVKWSSSNFSENLSRFYGQKLPAGSHKEVHCGTGHFLLLLVLDHKPIYSERKTTAGYEKVNTNVFDAKQLYRKWTGGGHKIHATNTEKETDHDLTLLLGENASEFKEHIKSSWKGDIDILEKDILGADGWDSISQLFSVLNKTINYAVLRNFECLPYEYTLEEHGDIDLLTDNFLNIKYLSNAKPVYRENYRVLHRVLIAKKKILFDFRYVDDGYYDEKWEKDILRQREFSLNGFYHTDIENYFYSLLYHAMVHKKFVAEDYIDRLTKMACHLKISLNSNSFRDGKRVRSILDRYLKKRGYSYTEPNDLSVFFNENFIKLKPISTERIIVSSNSVGQACYRTMRQWNNRSVDSDEILTSRINKYSFLRDKLSWRRHLLIKAIPINKDSRILELEAEAGSVTRYLGESFLHVDSFVGDPDLEKSVIERCRGLKNVHINKERFLSSDLKKKYDIVILIGDVLSGQKLSTHSYDIKQGAIKASKLLKENGLFIMAVENKLSLKSLNIYNNGLPDQKEYHQQKSASFSKMELKGFFDNLGFSAIKFIYSFPDHKFPKTFITDEAASLNSRAIGHWVGSEGFIDYKGNHNASSRTIDSYGNIGENGLLGELANSFLIIAAKSERYIPELHWQLLSINGESRNSKFRTCTIIKSSKPLATEKSGKSFEGHIFKFNPNIIRPLYEGDTLEISLLKSIKEQDIKTFISILNDHIKYLLDKYPGKFLSHKNKLLVEGAALDLIYSNIIGVGNELKEFDTEWSCKHQLPVAFIVFRSLLSLCNSINHKEIAMNLNLPGLATINSPYDVIYTIMNGLETIGRLSPDLIRNFMTIENAFQDFVTYGSDNVEIKIVLNRISKQLITKTGNMENTHADVTTRFSQKPENIYPGVSKQGTSEENNDSSSLVSIIMLTRNALDFTRKAVGSLYKYTSHPFELIIVDNGSNDDTRNYLQKLKKIHDNIKLILNDKNRGFAGGNNQGISVSSGNYILLMNNDIVVTVGWLERMIACMKRHPRAGIVGPTSNYVSGPQLIKTAEYNLQTLADLAKFANQLFKQKHGQDQRLLRVVGFCMLIKRDVIEKIGGMDTRYGLGNFEDDDFSLRAALAGFESWMAEDCFVHHFGSRTFIGEKIDYKKSLNQNWRLFKKKWGLPENLPYGSGYRLKNTQFTPEIHYVPLIPVQDGKSLSFGNKSSDGGTIEALYSEAQSLLKNNQDQQAVKKFERLLELNPSLAVAHNDLGVLYFRMGYKDKALKQYHAANRLDPDNMNFKKNLADFYCIELGKIEEAIQLYVEILEVAPDDTETLLAMGHICRLLGKNEEASSFYSSVLRVDGSNEEAIKILHLIDAEVSSPIESPSDATLYSALMKNAGEEDPAATIKKMESFLSDFPDHAKAHNDIGMLYYHIQNKEKAKLHLEKAFQLQSDSMEIQKNLADFYLVELNLKNEALKIYQKITESNQEDIETLLISGNINVSLQRLDEAELLYEKVLEIDPSNAEANQNLKAVRQHRLATNEIPANNHKGHNKNDKKDRLNSLQDQKEPHKRNRIDRQKASIVINLKGLQSQIEMCVNSIQQHTLPDNYEILLVDNNAGKERLTWAQQVCQKNPCCRIIEPLQGQGAANIWNSAVEFAAYEVMALLPNDSVVPEHWLSDLLECMNSMSGVGPVGSMSNRTGGIQQDSNAENLDSESFLDYAKNFRKENRHRRIAGVEALSPACVIFRKKLLNRIGEFDSNFKTETLLIEDFCRRSALMGHLNVIAGDVLVYQSHSQTNKSNESDSDEIITIDRQVYAEKWNGFDAGGIVEREIRIQKLIVVAETGFQRGLVNQATETLLNGIGAYPDEKKIYLALAEGLVNYGQYQNALDVLNGMPDIEAENDSQRQGIAVSAIIQKPNANPNRCLWFNPEIKKIELMGYCHQGIDDLAKADHLADQILALSPNSAFAFNLKGMIAYKNNDPQSAQSLFEKAIATDPGYAEAYTNLGVILWDMEKPDDALGSFQRGFVLYPVDIDIAAAYHSAISELGHFHQAERFIRSAAGLYPHSKNIQYLFIDVLIQQNKTQAAMEKIEAAVTEFGVDDGILSSAVKIRESLGPMEIDKSDLSRPSVSLCMIVKNEEKYLAGCLNSVKPIVDEMIVVDTGSDDATKDIAQAFGAKVYDFKWSDDFAEARNYSLSKASGDWILIMDADEIISPIDYNLFAELVHLPRETPVAYSINTRNYTNLANNVGWMPNDGAYFQEQAGIGWLPSAKVRLYYRGESNIRFEGAVHEMLDPSLKRQGVEIETCSIQIHHYDRLYKERFDKKKEIYYQIGRKKLEEIGDDIVALKELAVQATNMEKNEEAIELWGRFIALKPEKLLLSEAYVNLCTIYARLGDFEKALKLSMRAVKMCPNMKEAQYNLAMAQLHTGNANEAVSLFRKLTRLHPNYYIAKFSLTAAYGCAGKMDEFVTNLEQIKNTAMGKTIGYTFAELIKVLHRAHQREYALNLTRYSIESGIVNKDLFSLYSQVLENRQSNISDTKNQNRPTEINHQQKISNHVTM